ncbi:MAG: hypothetical protein Q4D63_06130 [Neisseria animaloris]|nr:hypothetical protein [Neisseria animaloris]
MRTLSRWRKIGPNTIWNTSYNNFNTGDIFLCLQGILFRPSNQQEIDQQYNLQHGDIIDIDAELGYSAFTTRPPKTKLKCFVVKPDDPKFKGEFILRILPNDAKRVISTLLSGQIIILLHDHFSSALLKEACQQADITSIQLDENMIIHIPQPNSHKKQQPAPKNYATKTQPTNSDNNGCLPLIGIVIAIFIAITIFKKNDQPSATYVEQPSQVSSPIKEKTKQNKTSYSQSNRQITLPPNSPFVTLSNVHIRQCASKSCTSMGIIPKHATVITDYGNNQENGWYFVKYEGDFCELHNHTNKTGCVYWDSNIQATGWVYSENLAAQ